MYCLRHIRGPSIAMILSLLGLAGCDDSGSGYARPVPTPTVQSIQIDPPNGTVAAGTSIQLSATALYSDSAHSDVTSQVAWSSSNSAIATVAAGTGMVRAMNTGSATITAQFQGKSASTTVTVSAATLASIAITPAEPRIAAGTTTQLTATAVFSDNTHQDVTQQAAWSTSSSTVATVSSDSGAVQSVAEGSATITASFQGQSAAATLTVTPATLVSISVTPATSSAPLGTTQQYTATGIYSDNSTQNLTNSVTWTSSQTSTATIGNAGGSHGLATSTGVGTTSIIAASDSITGSATHTVTPATLVSISVTPTTSSIALGTTRQLTAVGTYSDESTRDLTNSVTWTSSQTSTATISNADGSEGLATSAGLGTTSITATNGSLSGSATLQVVTLASLVSITVAPATPSIPLGASQQFAAIGTFPDGSTQDLLSAVTWSSASTSIATISNAGGSNGLATAVATGSTGITATLGACPETPPPPSFPQ